MKHIIEKYEKDYDFIYSFANDTVLEFYPKFDFGQVQESNYWTKWKSTSFFQYNQQKSIDIDSILTCIISADTEMIHLYFTPDYDCKNLITGNDDTLFVRPSLKIGTNHVLFPLPSHA